MTIRALRKNPHERVTARLAGDVIDLHPDRGILQSVDDGTELASFSMEDDTDDIEVWLPIRELATKVHKGDHVRLWGRYVAMDVTDESRGRTDSLRFVASSLDVDDRPAR